MLKISHKTIPNLPLYATKKPGFALLLQLLEPDPAALSEPQPQVPQTVPVSDSFPEMPLAAVFSRKLHIIQPQPSPLFYYYSIVYSVFILIWSFGHYTFKSPSDYAIIAVKMVLYLFYKRLYYVDYLLS